ncbi:MAG: peptide chain release factor N(5)-glutamine methyltransferase [Bacteroidota bacterium]
MPTLRDLRNDISQALIELYDDREAQQIANQLLEHLSGTRTWDFSYVETKPEVTTAAKNALSRLLKHEPLQHILGEVEFYGLRLKVSPSVLIPRPETEELVQHIINFYQDRPKPTRVLDIGTGSGCLILTLAKEKIGTTYYGVDISESALLVAQQNAWLNKLSVNWLHEDFLNTTRLDREGAFDLVVSNPPYIPDQERVTLSRQVHDFEPQNALFVPDDEPIIFYKQLADWCIKRGLAADGHLFVETHHNYAKEVAAYWKQVGLENVCVKKDLQEKWRFVHGNLKKS